MENCKIVTSTYLIQYMSSSLNWIKQCPPKNLNEQAHSEPRQG